MASAVPHEPAPSTATLAWCSCSAFMELPCAVESVRGRGLRLIGRLCIQCVEVDWRQQELRETALRYQVRHRCARVREQHARANTADGALDVRLAQVAHQEDAGLFDLDQ